MGHLAKARTLDPLDFRVPLLEAQLLADKDNFAQARQAVNNALTLNPSAAEAWLLGGELAVLSFDFDTAERMAARLDELAIIAEPDVALAEDRPETAPLAAAIRARALLRQNDPSSARLLMAPHAEAMPDSPLIGETGAMITAASYDLPALTSALDAFERRFPGPMGATAALRAGQTLSDLRQYAPATDTLTRAATLAPSWAAPATELGLLEMQRGRDDQAILALRTGTRLDPFNVRAANSLKLLDKLATFTRVESDHFIVRAAPGLDSRLAREMLPVLERIHAIVTANTGPGLAHSPAQKTIIDLSPDHASFAVRIAGISRIHTIAASTGPVIAMEAPRSGRGHTGAYDWARVLQHEYVHTVGLDKTGNRLPHWFTEAQAVYLEQAPRDWSTIKLLHQTVDSDDLFDLDAINIAFTRPKRPQDRALAYAQGHWMYEYLVITHGTDAPLALMRLYAQGVREEEAFSRVLNQSRAAFLEAFKPWARAQLQSWGMFSDEADALEVQIRTALESAKGIVDESIAAQLTQYATLRPVDPLSHRLLAQYWLTREPDKAIEHLRWLDVRSDKESTYAAQIAAIALRATPPRLDEAWPSAQRAVQIDPYNPAHRELAALVALQRTDYSAAEAHLQFLAELEPTRDQHTRRLEALQRLRRQ
jgi:tetratricopeptide (TPR) repeat protein